jgi:hypothetical protein
MEGFLNRAALAIVSRYGYAMSMSEQVLATDATKTSLENSVGWFLADKQQDASVSIATNKYVTPSNVLVQLTQCSLEGSTVPRIKVQVTTRVGGGVQELGYQLFGDHRFTKYVNNMMFGKESTAADGNDSKDVTEDEAAKLLGLINSLGNARQTM